MATDTNTSRNKGTWRRFKIRFKLLLRRILHQNDSPERIARGISAGCFAACIPTPGLQIPLSIGGAYLLKGNRAVSIFPQFISNAGTMLPLAWLQYHIGSFLWPTQATVAADALGGLEQALQEWLWRTPWTSTVNVFQSIGELGIQAIGPMSLGILITGVLFSILGYFLTVAAVRFWRHRKGRFRYCASHTSRPFRIDESTIETLAAQEIIKRFGSKGNSFHQAEDVTLLIDGRQVYPEMLKCLDQAKLVVNLETYMLEADGTGTQFSEALTRASQRGVSVRLLIDAVGSMGLPSAFLDNLIHSGVQVSIYHPLLFTRPPWSLNRRDHRKILTVDSNIAFTGGVNITDLHVDTKDGSRGWRDTHVRIKDPTITGRLNALFEQAWEKSKPVSAVNVKFGASNNNETDPAQASQNATATAPTSSAARLTPGANMHPTFIPDVATEIVSNREFLHRWKIQRAYIQAIYKAKHYILIQNAYFIPSRRVRRALYKAIDRGVRVAVVIAENSDVGLSAKAGRFLHTEMLSKGVRFFEWPGGMMHAKTAVIDDAWSVVGSYNLNNRSLFHDLEAVALFADARFARALRNQNLLDIESCQEVDLSQLKNRPWQKKLHERLAFMLRYWL